MGREPYIPSEQHIETAYQGALKGLTEVQIAESIGIGRSTFQRHKDAFRGAIKKARAESVDPNCDRVEDSLLKEATGYEFQETHIEQIKEKKTGKVTAEKIKIITKWFRPNPLSMVFYLINKRSDLWQSIHKVDVVGNVDNVSDRFKEISKIMRERDLGGKSEDAPKTATRPDPDTKSVP